MVAQGSSGRRVQRILWGVCIGIVTVGALGALAMQVSPWPSAMLIRLVFDHGGARANAALASQVPSGIRSESGLRYDPADADALMDIHRPSSLDSQVLPVIVWIHGGGFVAGSRGDVANYARMLSADGYAVVTVDYSLAPEHRYPLPVHQLSRALAFLADNAERLKLDMSRLVLGGDSAGAQLAAQLALIATSSRYAQLMAISSAISSTQLRGVVLFCGPLDGGSMTSSPSWFGRTVVWSYFGSTSPPPEHDTFSIVPRVTSHFPATFITVGNGDPLAPQSMALAEALQGEGVSVDTLFYPAPYRPKLGHEYQFDFSLPEAREAFARTRAFLRERLAATGL